MGPTTRRPYEPVGSTVRWRGLAAPLPPENACGARGIGGTPSDPDSIDLGEKPLDVQAILQR